MAGCFLLATRSSDTSFAIAHDSEHAASLSQYSRAIVDRSGQRAETSGRLIVADVDVLPKGSIPCQNLRTSSWLTTTAIDPLASSSLRKPRPASIVRPAVSK